VPVRVDKQTMSELAAVKQMVAAVLAEQRAGGGEPTTALPCELAELYAKLIDQQVTRELADEVIAQARERVGDDEQPDAEAWSSAVRAALGERMPVDRQAEAVLQGGDGAPRVIALVGPTGVGKTTTVAKLAATAKLKHGRRVGLLTLDTYRIAAVEQLRTYAELIEVPLQVVQEPDRLAASLEALADCDLVLIDTAGRSQRDGGNLEQLRSLLETAEPDQVHLVLSAAADPRVLGQVVERFEAIRTDRVIFTKLDEAVSYGVMINIARRLDKPVSYLTTGQEVPHQIEAGRAERVCELMLGAEVGG
jgi:flagellar biosynthesis protein FlhF